MISAFARTTRHPGASLAVRDGAAPAARNLTISGRYDMNVMPDDQFLRWMMSQLNAQLFDYRALRSGRVADELAQLQKALRERDETVRRYETQINEQHQQLREIGMLKDRVGQLQTELAQATQERDELVADLATSRRSCSVSDRKPRSHPTLLITLKQ
jgi:hypothetical protein